MISLNKSLIISSLFFGIITTTFSCDEKEELQQTGKVSFTTNDIIELESATQALTLNVGVDTYGHQGGTVHVEVTGANYGTDYTLSTGSSSFDIKLDKGKQVGTFSITTINNIFVDGPKELTFTITNTTGDLILGNDTELKVKLLDDDVPTIGTATFVNTSINVNEEDTTNKNIRIEFNNPATYGGTISIATTGNAVLGTDYSIQGQTTNNFTITVPPYATSAQFVVNSIDDSILDYNKTATFTITGVTGSLQFATPYITSVKFIDGEIVPVSINQLHDFEASTGSTYLTSTLGYAVKSVTQSPGITTLMVSNTTANAYAAANGTVSATGVVTGTSNSGINLNFTAGSPANPALLGELDQVLISPNFTGNGNVTWSVDCSSSFTAQNNALVTFYWSETYNGSTFNLSEWTELGTTTAAELVAAGQITNGYIRKTFGLSPQNNFRIAIRVKQTITDTYYRTRWRFDNIKLTN